MTGFARTGGGAANLSWTMEAKSVNGRGLDVRFKLSPPFDVLEPEMRLRAQRALTRGSVQIGITGKRDTSGAVNRVNEELFLRYAETAERLAWKANLAAATVGEIMRLPGVIEANDTEQNVLSDAVRLQVFDAFDALLSDLVRARRSEGSALKAVVSDLLKAMAKEIAAAEDADKVRRGMVIERLRSQIAAITQASVGLDEQRLHQEAILMATRIDIREELDRLNAHIEQGNSLLDAKFAVGRKLDFLSQELVRETNTLCSKANDLALTRIGLDLKALVEQFREQVQNIE